MGGGPDKEFLLIAHFSPEPTDTIKQIKQRFPYIDITYIHLSGGKDEKERERLKGISILFPTSTTQSIALGSQTLAVHGLSTGNGMLIDGDQLPSKMPRY